MSQTASLQQQKSDAGGARVDTKLEVALIPVSDLDRAKEFYTKARVAARRHCDG
jgi:hypothetical protein